jgi:beta-phosphoglucomutase-like phosphatase (HAD superfamily)
MVKAVIFDMDGTLVDSVDLHAKAWRDAFRDFGHEFDLKAIRNQIGKGGDQLLPVFLTQEEIATKGPELEKHRLSGVRACSLAGATESPRKKAKALT